MKKFLQKIIYKYKILKDKIGSNWVFFLLIFFIFVGVSIFDFSGFGFILKYFGQILWNVLPILLLVYIFIFVFSLFFSHDKVVKFLAHGNYIKKMFLAIIIGIISSGPMYLWYGFLKKLHKAGLTLGHITGFSYARAIKPPLFALMIHYFDLKYTLIFISVLFVCSFVQCLLIDGIAKKISLSNN